MTSQLDSSFAVLNQHGKQIAATLAPELAGGFTVLELVTVALIRDPIANVTGLLTIVTPNEDTRTP